MEKEGEEMPLVEFLVTVASAFLIAKEENDKNVAIEKVILEGKEVEEQAMNWKEEYPLLDTISARLFGKRTATLVYVFGCRSHPNMLVLISLTQEGTNLVGLTNIKNWIVKEVPGPHAGMDETIQFHRGKMMELAQAIDKRYIDKGVPSMEAYLLENAIPDHSNDLTSHLTHLSKEMQKTPKNGYNSRNWQGNDAESEGTRKKFRESIGKQKGQFLWWKK